MPIVAFTFGSFGDITAILRLAWAIRQSLSETGSAVAQVQTLITDIDTFTRALQQIKSALETRASVPQDLMNGIALALEQCFKLLLRVKQRIDAYNSRVTGAVGLGALRQDWAAIEGEFLGGEREVDALRTRLSDQVEVIQALLAAADSRYLEEIRKSVQLESQKLDDVRKDAESTTLNVNEMFASTRELCIRLSATAAPFTFFDVSGAQLLPLGVMRRTDEDHTFLSPLSGTGNSATQNEGTVAKISFRNGTEYEFIYSSPTPFTTLGDNPGHEDDVDFFMFLTRHGDEEVAFVSPVYRTYWERDPSPYARVPEVSAALSGYIRRNSNRRIDVVEFRDIFVKLIPSRSRPLVESLSLD